MSERFSRQKDLVPEEALGQCAITVIGVGAVGRQVALQLSAMGAQNLQLIDHDHVEESNLASQGYLESDLGKPKVIATGETCKAINSKVNLSTVYNRFKRSGQVGNVIFCCVDKIQTRRIIWESVGVKANFFVDGRMSGEVLRVINAYDDKSREHYGSTLFSQAEAQTGSCTAKTTIYCANIAAGRMVARFAQWLRHVPLEHDILVNLLSDELSVNV